jgi:hypothetical protein
VLGEQRWPSEAIVCAEIINDDRAICGERDPQLRVASCRHRRAVTVLPSDAGPQAEFVSVRQFERATVVGAERLGDGGDGVVQQRIEIRRLDHLSADIGDHLLLADSGGPLVVHTGRRVHLFGIRSHPQ